MQLLNNPNTLNGEVHCVRVAYREAFLRVDLNHATEESLAVWRNEVRHVKYSTLHLLQQLTQVIMVKGQRSL